MAKNKNQHFVPQFWLKNFSIDRKRLSLYIIETDQHRTGASIKHQASNDYFYGRGETDKKLTALENDVAPVITSIIKTSSLPRRESKEWMDLLTFIMLQSGRTPTAAEEINELDEKTAKGVARNLTSLKIEVNNISIDDPEAPIKALRCVEELVPFALDLGWKLLLNKTKRPFVISDHPVIRYNMFLEKRKFTGGHTGWNCKGLQVFLPLGPQHVLMLYDKDVYRVGGRRHLEPQIEIGEADVSALNVLQAANAGKVLYFRDDTDLFHVRETAKRARSYRRSEKIQDREAIGIGPGEQEGPLILVSKSDLKLGLTLECVVFLPSAAGTPLGAGLVHLRNPELVGRFQERVMSYRKFDAQKVVEFILSRRSTGSEKGSGLNGTSNLTS